MIHSAIRNPVTVIVIILLIILFGIIGLQRMPYQLTPVVTEPEISVQTVWPGATPYEIEREIIEEQETVLKNVPDLKEYESSAQDNMGAITLRFHVGTDLDQAMLEVSNKLNQVPSYPENVDKPIIQGSGENTSPVIWMMLRPLEGNDKPIIQYQTFFDNELKEYFERINGVAGLFVGGGTVDELHVVVDNEKLAAHGLTIDALAAALARANADVSAGTLDVGRRSFRIRTVGQYRQPADVEKVVLVADGQRRVTVGDVADVLMSYKKKEGTGMFLGDPGIFCGVRPEVDANVMELTAKVEEVANRLNEEVLAPKGLKLLWLYDQRNYINGAIDLVKQNIAIGGLLAIIVLLVFLRSIASTAVVGLAIPVSIISTFIVLEALGRSINMISMAGIAFAVGMLLDSAIVVLENIDRHKKMGKPFTQAAYEGTMEVWGALIASGLTTIAVFLPVIFLEDEAGQLFKDIAIAVTAAITFSFFVSIFAIPMMWRQIMRLTGKDSHDHSGERHRIVEFGHAVVEFFMKMVNLALKNNVTRLSTITILAAASGLLVWSMFPKMEYLPEGNRNLVFNIMIPPPGLSLEEKEAVGQEVFRRIMPHVHHEKDGFPAIERAFFVVRGPFMIFGAISESEERAHELIGLFSPIVNSFPGIFGISKQAGLFEQGIGQGRSINVDISGPDIEKLANVGGAMFGMIRQSAEGVQVRPVPSIELLFPEIRLVPDREKLEALGMDATSLGLAADVLMDGRKVSEYKADGEKTIDLILKGSDDKIQTPEELYNTQIATPGGQLVPISQLAELERTTGISEIRHFNGIRTITLQVTPPPSVTIQEMMENIETKMIPGLQAQGMLNGVDVSLSGTADKLVTTVSALGWNFVLAVFITYLLMSSLFANFIYPLVILFTVPLAMAGGFLGLKLTNMFIAPQPLDIVTLLGFIILVGIVVNNAILIVHQSLNNIRNQGMEHKEAILEATRSRIRPIYMSSLTSLFGMLPLVIAPGPGSEFYRGLGSVISGGLAVSTFFTIFVIPALLIFVIKMEKGKQYDPADDEPEAVKA